jgi:hypothetical protein
VLSGAANELIIKTGRLPRPLELIVMQNYIVELCGGTQFLAPWQGDPGRTCVRDRAKKYKSEHAAKCAIAWNKRMFKSRDFSEARVVPA